VTAAERLPESPPTYQLRAILMRIAILQRDPLQRQLIEKILEQAGHSCLTYDDGLSMSKALACSTVDLLVLDWNGVRLSGADVLKAVRSVGGDRMPVVFASRDTSEESAVRAFLAGADDYVLLPVRPAEFRERIAALLRRAYPDRHGVANFDVGPYHFDGRRQLVTLRGVPVPLSGTQYRLASLFFACCRAITSSRWCGAANSASSPAPSTVTCRACACCLRSVRKTAFVCSRSIRAVIVC
jgi:DNA-binding response OmpR family regulator